MILTRRNDRRLGISGTDWVKNGDRWTITHLNPDGSLRAQHTRSHLSVVLPAEYVAGHVELGYATTVNAAQGSTADVAHGILTGDEDRQLLYTMLTLGRAENHLHLVTEPAESKDEEQFLPGITEQLTAIEALDRIIGRDGTATSATSERAHHAEALGLRIVDEYVEPGRSATTAQNRPEYQAMMKRISSQRDVDYVIVYQLSRLNRNRVDDALVMLQMDAAGVKLISATENIDDSPAGQMTRGILAAINQYRSASEGEDIARKLAHKATLGGTIGRAPLGYLNVKEDVDGRMVSAVAIDEARASLIRAGFELYATGDYSLERLAQTMDDRGLAVRATRRHPGARSVSVSKWHSMLANPYYMGLMPFKGELYPGRHQAIVTPELFAVVQETLKERSAPTRRDRTHFHYLKKLTYCGRCDKAGRRNPMIFTRATAKGGEYDYFVCMGRKRGECDLPYLPASLVEDHVVRHYGTLHLSDGFVQTVIDGVREAVADEQSSIRELHAVLPRKLADLDKREERLIDLAEDGLPQDKIRERLNTLRTERARLEVDVTQSGAALAAGAEVLEACIQLAADVRELYVAANDEARGALNDALFRRIYVDEDGVHGAELREPFAEIVDAGKVHEGIVELHAPQTDSAPDRGGPRTTRARGAVSTSLSHLVAVPRGKDLTVSTKHLMADLGGFEPPRALTQPAFQASAIGH